MFRSLPAFGGDQRAVAEVVRGIMDGKTNNTGTLTLATGGATTTTLTFIFLHGLGPDSDLPTNLEGAQGPIPHQVADGGGADPPMVAKGLGRERGAGHGPFTSTGGSSAAK